MGLQTILIVPELFNKFCVAIRCQNLSSQQKLDSGLPLELFYKTIVNAFVSGVFFQKHNLTPLPQIEQKQASQFPEVRCSCHFNLTARKSVLHKYLTNTVEVAAGCLCTSELNGRIRLKILVFK